MNALIKQELHQLIDECNDDLLLVEAKAFLEENKDSGTGDWWDELSEEDRSLVMESELSYQKGDFIDHEDLMKQLMIKINATN